AGTKSASGKCNGQVASSTSHGDHSDGNISEDTSQARSCGPAASDPAPPLLPPPPPHPIFGSRKGKAGGGGGGGGRLVEALRPLISGNARCWLVVSVGGGGSGGAGAAWHALDVARRATSICTTCIRLRGISVADLRLRDAAAVLHGDYHKSRSATASSPSPAAAGGTTSVQVDVLHRRVVPNATANSAANSAVAIAGASAIAGDGVENPDIYFPRWGLDDRPHRTSADARQESSSTDREGMTSAGQALAAADLRDMFA
ncbi:unnamed protein product, partial [Sphacelaria rigidula]